MLNRALKIKQDLPIKNNSAGFRLGFEIWEILTMLTVVLTIASSIMWFNNLTPMNVRNDFLRVEKEKHFIFSKYYTFESTLNKKLNLLPNQSLSASCYTEILQTQLNSEPFDTSYETIKSGLKYVQTTTENINSSKSSNLEDKNFSKLLKSYQNYLQGILNRLENQYIFERQILAIKKQAVKVCTAKQADIMGELNLLEKRLEDLQEFNFDQFYSWKDNLSAFISYAQDIYTRGGESAEILKTSDYIDNLSQRYGRIFQIQYNFSKHQKVITNQSTDLENSLKQLEAWQKDFTVNKENYEGKIVYIF